MTSRSNINDSFAAEDLHSLDAALLRARTASTNPVYTGASQNSPFAMQLRKSPWLFPQLWSKILNS